MFKIYKLFDNKTYRIEIIKGLQLLFPTGFKSTEDNCLHTFVQYDSIDGFGFSRPVYYKSVHGYYHYSYSPIDV